MSMKFMPDNGERYRKLRTDILAEVSAQVEQKTEDAQAGIISGIRAGLVSAPEPGEAWDARKCYISGDAATVDGVSYTATRFSRGKKPDENQDRWMLTPSGGEATPWEDIPEGEIILAGRRVTYDGYTWVCKDQHMKSIVYRPKTLSTKWEREG
ncbi:MAG: hypothetical protein RR296_05810 [Clostridia bacterium]